MADDAMVNLKRVILCQHFPSIELPFKNERPFPCKILSFVERKIILVLFWENVYFLISQYICQNSDSSSPEQSKITCGTKVWKKSFLLAV